MLRAGKVSVGLMSVASDRGTDGGSTQQGLSVAQEPPKHWLPLRNSRFQAALFRPLCEESFSGYKSERLQDFPLNLASQTLLATV